MASNRSAAISFIFITLLIDVTGIGLIIPVVPGLIEQLIHGTVSEASKYSGYLAFAYAIMQFLFAPLLGNLSDKYGRRPILLLSLLGLGIDYIFLTLAPSIGWLFVGRLVAGFAGASFTTATAYIADISTPENRAQNFGMVGAAFGLGFILGPVMGGLLGEYGVRVPFVVAACLSFINCLYGYFVLPESLTVKNRREFQWKRANPVGSLKQLQKYPAVSGLILSFFLIYLGANAVQSTWSFFGIKQFNWTPRTIGISLGLVGLLVGAVQGGLIRIVNPWLGNKKSVYAGLALYAIGLFLFSIATQSWMMFLFLVPYCLGGLCGPALQSIISGQVPANEQGELQGGLTSIISVTNIIGPILMTGLFSYFSKANAPVHFAGAAFFLGGIFMVISLVLAYRTLRHNKTIS
ncbi:TCR/Tet family MFS transporter [Ferruginibacter sp.]|uniref:TCR/Tet family MFS transporter n=1 Tax=Ferruginibacter sp. TaxID=1940288 RepID=UPI00265B2DFB|nr:TCR/Tet family MFS transporter [Ferruginibacter sp.]